MNKSSIILVTGLSGAGRATALNALEDCGYHRVDNLPPELVPLLLQTKSSKRPLALGFGSRRTAHDNNTLIKILEEIGEDRDASLLFLEASDEAIMRRYNETRRTHPSAEGRMMQDAITHERKLLAKLLKTADVVIDTSNLSPHDLRAEIKRQFDLEDAQTLVVTVQSFSYKRGTPPSADMILDCRFLKNPHWESALRDLTGMDKKVQDYVQSDPNYDKFYEDVKDMLSYILPAMQDEGRSYFNLAFGCTGGKHRSVTLAHAFAQELRGQGFEVYENHREQEIAVKNG